MWFKELFKEENFIFEKRDTLWILRDLNSFNVGFAMFSIKNYKDSNYKNCVFDKDCDSQLYFIHTANDKNQFIQIIDEFHLKNILEYIKTKRQLEIDLLSIKKYANNKVEQRNNKIKAVIY